MMPFRATFPARRVVTAILIVLGIVAGGSVGYYVLGGGAWTWSDCIYMVATTVSTVGFREVIPVGSDNGLRAYTILLIFAGGGSMLYLLSIITAFLVEGDLNVYIRRRRMEKEIERLRGHYLVCGLGRNGEQAAERLLAAGRGVVVIDHTEARIRAFMDSTGLRPPFVIGDATDEDVLTRAGLAHAAGMIASLPEDQDNLMAILSARQVNKTARIVGKSNEKRSRHKFLLVGADAVVSPQAIGGRRLFTEMLRPGVTGFLDSVLDKAEEDLGMDEIEVGEGSPLLGKRLADSEIRQRTNLLVVGFRDDVTRKFTYNPGSDWVIKSGVTLIVLGPAPSIEELRRMVAGA